MRAPSQLLIFRLGHATRAGGRYGAHVGRLAHVRTVICTAMSRGSPTCVQSSVLSFAEACRHVYSYLYCHFRRLAHMAHVYSHLYCHLRSLAHVCTVICTAVCGGWRLYKLAHVLQEGMQRLVTLEQ